MKARHGDWKAEILGDFASWLLALPPDASGHEDPQPKKRALADLYSEVAALRREVAAQNRAGKQAQLRVESATAAFSDLGGQLNAQLRAIAESVPRRDAELDARSVVVSFLEIRDSIVRTRSLAARLLSLDAGEGSGASDGRDLVETLALIIRKFDRILAAQKIAKVPTVGHPFDPSTMNAAGTRALPGTPDGTVVEELRGGFLHEGRLIRTAEVFVNRSQEELEEADGANE